MIRRNLIWISRRHSTLEGKRLSPRLPRTFLHSRTTEGDLCSLVSETRRDPQKKRTRNRNDNTSRLDCPTTSALIKPTSRPSRTHIVFTQTQSSTRNSTEQ